MTAVEVLAALAASAGYATWAYCHPFKSCPRCKATGVNALSTPRRRGKCRRCKGTREVRTLGARVLHRAVRSIRGYRHDRKGR